ncbi:hypothetical protein PABG_06457 [Paracoccidioides brasiliensis Pb03]|nr:hypothetical protein PABG_06457 [Paracoccidioides brasiliensis Pb03]
MFPRTPPSLIPSNNSIFRDHERGGSRGPRVLSVLSQPEKGFEAGKTTKRTCIGDDCEIFVCFSFQKQGEAVTYSPPENGGKIVRKPYGVRNPELFFLRTLCQRDGDLEPIARDPRSSIAGLSWDGQQELERYSANQEC